MWDNSYNNSNPVPPAYTQHVFEPVAVSPVPQKTKKPLILILFVAVVVLALGVGAAILLLNKKSEPVAEETFQDIEETGPIYVTEDLIYALEQVYPPVIITNVKVALYNHFSTVYPRGTEFNLDFSSLNSDDDYGWHIKASNGESHVVVVTWSGENVKIVIDDEFEQEFTNSPHYDD